VYEGVLHIVHAPPLESAVWNYWVLGIAAVFESISWLVGVRAFMRSKPDGLGVWEAFRRSKDPTVFTVVFEDSAALVGLALAFLGVFLSHRLGRPWIDGAASICIGLLLAAVAVVLARESKNLLVGERADLGQVRDIARIVASDPAVRGADRPMTMQLAPDEVLLNLGLHFREGLTLGEVEGAVDRLEAKIRGAHPEVKRIFIEAQSFRETDTADKPAR
jgi:divalent metal cation (Fe/Co/Zn/Cd) transporter